MKRILLSVLGLVVCMALNVRAADAVEPVSVVWTNIRDEAQDYISSAYFYYGTTVRGTNLVMYAGTSTNSARQGLDGVTIDVNIGTTSTNLPYVGAAIDASNGTWWVDFVVPSNIATVYIQTKITDTNTNIYIYPWKMMRTKEAM